MELMINELEKIIKTLECCIRSDNSCDGCPMYGVNCWCESDNIVTVPVEAVDNAIAFLKTMEPVRPNEIRIGKMLIYYQCPICTSEIDEDDQYCSHCGRAIKWQ